jgi:KaiC/GvpD/RAD55 family RecA-like ATPase
MEAINRLHSISFRDDLSIPIADFEVIRKRYAHDLEKTGALIPTGIEPLDKVLGGGLERGRLGVIMAEAKKGKSICLLHMGATALMTRRGYIAHVVLEGTTEETVMRYQSRLSGIPYKRVVKDDLTAVEVKKLEMISAKYLDRLQLIPFNQHWDYTVLDLESKLQELDRQGKTPDLCVVDYADLLNPRQSDSRRRDLEQRDVYRELKRLAIIRKMPVWTASQAVRPKAGPIRGGTSDVLHGSSIAESYEKVRIADFIGSLNQTPEEKKQGVMRFHCDVYRSSASDKTIRLIVNFNRMILHTAHFGTISEMHIPDWMRKVRMA